MITYTLQNPLLADAAPESDAKGHHEIHGLQRALQHAGIYKGQIDGAFGAGTALSCKQAKWRLGYPRKAVVETGGQQLYDFLTGKKGLPLAYQARRRARGYGISKNQKTRDKIVATAKWGVRNTLTIHYAQIRPFPLHLNLPMTTDCSGFVTLCYFQAGAKDPNALGYSGQGWTGTLLNNGYAVPVYQAQPGDLVIWGSYPGHHVAVIIESDPRDPLIVSHGSEIGPLMLRLSAEHAAQHGRSYVVRRYFGT